MPEKTISVRLTGTSADLQAALRAAAAEVDRFAGRATSGSTKAAAAQDKVTKSAQQSRESMQGLGLAAAAAGAAITAGMGKAVSAFADFDSVMSNVKAATRGSAGSLDQLRQAALDAGSSTVFSATESAAAIENLAKAGVGTGDILGGALSGSLALAASGQLDVAQAAEIAAGAMAQFKLKGTDVPHIADLLAAGAGKAAGSVEDMAAALGQSGLVAAQMGISIEETTGTLAAFASNMLLGSDAGTSFRSLLLHLVNPTKESAALMKDLGIAAYDASGNFVGVANLAGQLQTAFEGQSQATRDAALAQIFGSDAIRAASILYSEGAAGINEWTKQTNDAGFAAQDAATRLDNLKGDLEALSGALSTEFINAGAGANGVLRELTQSATGTVQLFGQLPGPVKQTASGLVLAAGAASAAAGAFILGAPKIAAFRTELSTMGPAGQRFGRSILRVGSILGGPWGLAIAAGTIALGWYAKKHAEARRRVEEFTAALRADSGALGENVRAHAARRLEQEGALRLATKYGISLKTVTDAALGNRTAQQQVNDVLNRQAAILTDLGRTRQATDYGDLQAIGRFRGSVLGLNNDLGQSQAAHKRQAEAIGATAGATGLAAAATGEFGTALAGAGGQMTEAQAAAQKWRDELAEIAGSFVDPAGAFQDALAAAEGAAEKSARNVAEAHNKSVSDQIAATRREYQSRIDAVNRKSEGSQKSIRALQQERDETIRALREQKGSWDDYAKSVGVSVDQVLDTLEKQVAAQRDWRTNMLLLSARGLSEGAIAELEKMGEEAAPLIAKLVNASDGELKRLEAAFRADTAAATGAIADQMIGAGPVLAKVAEIAGDKTARGLARKLVAGKTTLDDIIKQYRLTITNGIPEVTSTRVEVVGVLAASLRAREAARLLRDAIPETITTRVNVAAPGKLQQLERNTLRRAAGGPIVGPGTATSDSIVARLSHGEHVWTAAEVQRLGGHVAMDSLRRHVRAGYVPRFAEGGPVSRAGTATIVRIPQQVSETRTHQAPVYIEHQTVADYDDFRRQEERARSFRSLPGNLGG